MVNIAKFYEDHISKDKIKELLENKRKEYLEGILLNEKKEWFIKNNNEKIFINDMKSRNRALKDDEVVIKRDKKDKQIGIKYNKLLL